ncbi:MAG: MtrB/PioB family outer membrane beta-barrel protein, partial [Gammaproteobacteria bacterium]
MLQSLNMVVADVEATKNYDSELEVGIIYVSEDSFKSGEYTGLEEDGFHGNINFSIISPSAYDSDDEKKIFYEVTGTNLGLSSRSIFAEYGELGKYAVY